jgi:hypothetical protein
MAAAEVPEVRNDVRGAWKRQELGGRMRIVAMLNSGKEVRCRSYASDENLWKAVNKGLTLACKSTDDTDVLLNFSQIPVIMIYEEDED